MQSNQKYSDRRRNPRRSDARRSHERLNCSFEVSALDYEGKAVNVSASGVYFEVTTNNMETFPLGTSIPLQINTVTNMSEGQEIKLKLSGRGTVIRNCIIENPDRANSLGVAVGFTERFNIELDND